MKILELECEVKRKDFGVGVKFSGGFGNRLTELATEEEQDKMEKHMLGIIDIVNEVIEREIQGIRTKAEKDAEEVLGNLPKEINEILDNMEKELDNLKTPEEKARYLFKKLGELL